MSFQQSRSAHGLKTWLGLLGTVPLIFYLCILVGKAARESDAASRQQISFGTITDCYDGKQRSCHYIFSANGRGYAGTGVVSRSIILGQTRFVYYDSQNPRINSLKKLSDQSREDRNLAFYFLFLVGVLAAAMIYSSARGNGDSGQRIS